MAQTEDIFPPITDTTTDVVAWSEDIHISFLYEAYQKGIFPWPTSEDTHIPWFCPKTRAVLDFNDLHIPKSLHKFLTKTDYEFRINTSFKEVINHCASIPRAHEQGTWIDQRIIDSFIEFNTLGYALSFETWHNDTLVGGLYGVLIEGHFSGESMFHLSSNASKFALINTIAFLAEQGISWIDIQQLTPLFEQFGAKEISRNSFLQRIKQASQNHSQLKHL